MFFRNRWYFLAMVLALLAGATFFLLYDLPLSNTTSEKIPDVVDFNFHIRPILSDRCFKCHGPDANQRKADLRLDTEAGLFQALREDKRSNVVVPGNSKASELYRRLMAEDTSQVMPPPLSDLSVTDREKKLIRKWIDQGARYQKHWAFISPENRPPPEVQS